MDATVKAAIQNFYAENKTAVDALGSVIGVPGIWFCCMFYNESGLNPAATNSIGASGLNQMLPSTLAGLGTTPAQYIGGGVAYQCQVMQQFFKPVAGIIKRAGDLSLYNFWPAAIIDNYSAATPIGVKAGTGTLGGLSQAQVYTENAGLDFNGDGIINRQDFWDLFEYKYDELIDATAPAQGYFLNDLWIDVETNWIAWALILIIIVAVVIFIAQNKVE